MFMHLEDRRFPRLLCTHTHPHTLTRSRTLTEFTRLHRTHTHTHLRLHKHAHSHGVALISPHPLGLHRLGVGGASMRLNMHICVHAS